MLQSRSRAWAIVDRKAILHNVEEIKKLIGNHTEIMAVVKANAYGHGDSVIAKLLENHGITHFAVSSVDEALNLRKVGVTSDILILGYTPETHFHYLVEENLIQNFLSLEYAQKLNVFADKYHTFVRGHVKVDTGMGRLGIRYLDNEDGFDDIQAIYQLPNLHVEGIFSHFSVADELDENNLVYTAHQKELFDDCLSRLKQAHIEVGKTHIQNSYGVLNYQFDYDFVRPGLLLLGVTSDDSIKINSSPEFIAAMSLYANISCVKLVKKGSYISYGRHYVCDSDRVIATCSIGYADGIPRTASNKQMHVLVHGKRCPIVGNICMDQLMVDVSECENVREGDIVTLIGKDGNDQIKVDEWSRCIGTINNDMLCRISARVPRFYTSLK
ncbi:MAG: alanine racemase [Traorella sp.]